MLRSRPNLARAGLKPTIAIDHRAAVLGRVAWTRFVGVSTATLHGCTIPFRSARTAKLDKGARRNRLAGRIRRAQACATNRELLGNRRYSIQQFSGKIEFADLDDGVQFGDSQDLAHLGGWIH